MDYKMLHGTGSPAASSRSTAERGVSADVSNLRSALPQGAFDTIDEIEDLLVAVGERAPAELIAPTLEALTSGGKRLRPLLLVLCAEMGEPDRQDLLGAATAIEVLHTATLIHDDIVDRAESRRGAPTVEVEAYLEHLRKKTAGLFQASCVAGGTLGGLSLLQIDALATYGQALGIAFQMSDDIMDLVGKPGLMGKGIGTDLVEGTITLPVIFALREGDAATIRRVLADPAPPPELLEAGIEAVLATDAVARTEAWARGEIEGAIADLDLLPVSPEREFLEFVASEVVGRDV